MVIECIAGRKSAGRRRGYTLVEVVIGITVLVVAAAGAIASIAGGMRVREVNRETALAQLAAREQIELLKLAPFDEAFRIYNDSPADDPGGPGTAPGANFAVAGLDASLADLDGMPGRIIFPSAAGDPPTVLRENVADASFGMPRDLTGEGTIDANDHALDYRILPVRVAVEWRSASGRDRIIQFETYLAGR